MPDTVSVLMPVYRTDHFEVALRSVLAQTHADIEVLVGDNAGDRGAREIVEAAGDPRVVYVPSHAVSGRSARLNHLLLWWRARSRYVRFVYDDDRIDPDSTGVLLALLRKTPRVAMAWHQRRIIDAQGAVLGELDFLAGREQAVVDRPMLLSNLIRFDNFVGEPSFVMFDRQAVPDFVFSRYAGHDLAYLWDVAMYLDAADRGLLAGSARVLGSFRRHAAQVSASTTQRIGLIEWELILREEHARGRLDGENLALFARKVLTLYERRQADFAPLAGFRERLLEDLSGGLDGAALERFVRAYRNVTAAAAAV